MRSCRKRDGVLRATRECDNPQLALLLALHGGGGQLPVEDVTGGAGQLWGGLDKVPRPRVLTFRGLVASDPPSPRC